MSSRAKSQFSGGRLVDGKRERDQIPLVADEFSVDVGSGRNCNNHGDPNRLHSLSLPEMLRAAVTTPTGFERMRCVRVSATRTS